jgi:autotransporter-associated beta strand protein
MKVKQMKMKSFLTALAVSALVVGSAQANILVSSGSWNRLYSDTGTMLVSYTETYAPYNGNAVDSAGNVYFANYSYGIKKYNGATGAFISNVTDNGFFGAAWPVYGIASKSTGDLIASYTLGANHHFVHLNTDLSNTTPSYSPAFGPPYEGIAYNPVGDKFYATTPNGGGLIQTFNGTTGANVAGSVAAGVAPKGIAVNAAGDKIYFADNNAGQIRLWDGVSGTTSLFANLSGAYGVTVAPNGDVWATSHAGQTLNRYNSAGTLLNTVALGAGANPTFITYTSILEPVSREWDGGVSGTGKILNDAANWTPDGTPIGGDTLSFTNRVAGSLSLGMTTNIASAPGVYLHVAATQTGSVTITNNTSSTLLFYLNGPGGLALNKPAGSGAFTVGGGTLGGIQMILANGTASYTLENNSVNKATFASNVSWIRNGADSPTLVFQGSGNVDVLGNIDLGGGGITQVGPGTLTLGGVNTFTGNTAINGGTLALADNAGLKFMIGANGVNNRVSGTGAFNVLGDFTFDLSGASQTVGASWTIADAATLTETFGASFTVVGFTDAGGDRWTKDIDGTRYYEFSEADGVLTVVNVPTSVKLYFLK